MRGRPPVKPTNIQAKRDSLAALGGLIPPQDLLATGVSLAVDFAWTGNPDTDSFEFRSQTNADPITAWGAATSVHQVAAAEGDKVAGQVRAVENGDPGPPSQWTAALAGA